MKVTIEISSRLHRDIMNHFDSMEDFVEGFLEQLEVDEELANQAKLQLHSVTQKEPKPEAKRSRLLRFVNILR